MKITFTKSFASSIVDSLTEQNAEELSFLKTFHWNPTQTGNVKAVLAQFTLCTEKQLVIHPHFGWYRDYWNIFTYPGWILNKIWLIWNSLLLRFLFPSLFFGLHKQEKNSPLTKQWIQQVTATQWQCHCTDTELRKELKDKIIVFSSKIWLELIHATEINFFLIDR